MTESFTNEPSSYWLDGPEIPKFASLNESIRTDIVIVGGGIVGITAAYLLRNSGRSVTVLEGGRLLHGTTGYTTAKLSAQHGLIYDELISTFSEQQAGDYYEANRKAMDWVKQLVDEYGIDCGFETRPAYLYSESTKGEEQIEKEYEAYQKIGIPGATLTTETDLPFPIRKALRLDDQYQFHPVYFLSALVKEAQEAGVTFYENSRAKTVHMPSQVELVSGHKVDAQQVLVTSHFPFNDFEGLYFSRMRVERSYAMTLRGNIQEDLGMYINVESPTRSIRSVLDTSGERLLQIGGEGHVSGRHEDNTRNNYAKLRDFAGEHFGTTEVTHNWSSQDLLPLDHLPYIGQMVTGMPHVFVATGFSKWGMSNGIAAAHILHDLALDRTNPYEELFSPTRSKMKAKDVGSFIKDNAGVAKELIKGKVTGAEASLEELGLDEGKIVRVDGQKLAAYKDEQGTVTFVKPACTHMGCDVAFNQAERSWDCPCHGSRFSYRGDVIEGPATEPLEQVHPKHS